MSKRAFLFPILLVIFISFAVYFNALSNGFVYDDDVQILKNRWITDLTNMPEVFSKSVWSFQSGPVISNYYRPLMHSIYMFNYHFFGFNPLGFHLVNILFHAAASVLVFLIAVRLLSETQAGTSVSVYPPLMAALLFAAHPIHTEAVTWIAGLPEVSFAFFYLLSLCLFIWPKEDTVSSRRAYVLSVVSFFIATLCKETALTLPIILIVYHYVFRKTGARPSDNFKKYGLYLVVAGVYLMMRFIALGGLAPQKRYVELSTFQLIINVLPLFAQYLEKLFLPVNLNAFHVFHPISSLLETKGILSLLITTAFIVFTFMTLRKNKAVFISLLLIIVPLLPVLYIPGLGENTFTERYLYLPSVGFVVILAWFVSWTKVNFPRGAIMATVVPIVIMGLYSVGTASRNTLWKDDYTLYTDMVKKSPEGNLPHYFIATVYLKQGRIDEAIEETRISLNLKPRDATILHNLLGSLYAEKGWADDAINEFKAAIKLEPYYALSHFSLGVMYEQKGQLDDAIKEYLVALRLRPDVAEGHNNLGLAYEKKGRVDEAVQAFLTAARLKPDFAEAHHNLGVAYAQKSRIAEALTEIETAIRLKPDFPLARENYRQLTLEYQKEKGENRSTN